MKKFFYNRGEGEILVLMAIILLFSIIASGGIIPKKLKPASDTAPRHTAVSGQTFTSNQDLQLNTLTFQTTTPGADCGGDTAKTGGCTCKPPPAESEGVICNNATNTPSTITVGGGTYHVSQSCPGGGIPCSLWNEVFHRPDIISAWQCTANSCVYVKDNVFDANDSANPNFETYEAQCGDHGICFAKPIIYLYPTKDTYVDVTLSIPGVITTSIPHYETDGWQDVLAHPDGHLEYKGASYKELFYESEVANVITPQRGIIIAKKQLRLRLDVIMTQLGLNTMEKEEFLDYWMPKLKELKGQYILFSLIDPKVKEHVDGIHATPAPDTRIEILAYFKPLDTLISVEPLVLPKAPPVRRGFTMVEWGATIDESSSLL